jgi:hypothetical protein
MNKPKNTHQCPTCKRWVNRSTPFPESRTPKLEPCWIIVVAGDDDQPDELATRTAFPNRDSALARIESYAPQHHARCIIVHCPKGVDFILK